MFELIEQLLADLNLDVRETVDIPPRPESTAAAPKAITGPGCQGAQCPSGHLDSSSKGMAPAGT